MRILVYIVYFNGKELKRSKTGEDRVVPSPWETPVGAYLISRNKTRDCWYTRKAKDCGWQSVSTKNVPNVYQLLYLLE